MSNMWKVYNSSAKHRILVTKQLPGEKWLKVLTDANCRVEVNASKQITSKKELASKLEDRCTGVIGQLTEKWDSDLLAKLNNAGGKLYCNYAVGYDNIDIEAASKNDLAIGNTPGVLTETTAEMAVALTLACARRIVESDRFVREDKYKGWLPDLFLGERLKGKTVGIVGTGRIGSAYAVMMAQGFKMQINYYSRSKNKELENAISRYNGLSEEINDEPLNIKQTSSLEELLKQSDIISLHTPLNEQTHHLIKAEQLSQMKNNAILVNTSRGPIIDEEALTKHCEQNKHFKAGLDVFEDEPLLSEGLKELPNVTLAPHLGSATSWTREAMSLLSALNVKGVIKGYPVWDKNNISPFLGDEPPKAIPSLVNDTSIGLS